MAISRSAHAAASDQIKVALLGCGRRGTGAAAQALSTDGPVKLWAMADAFQDRLETSLENLTRGARVSQGTAAGLAGKIDTVAQGRIWPGGEAKDIGLVDEMGDLDAALAHAAKLGGVGNKKWHAVYMAEKPDRFAEMLRSLFTRPNDTSLSEPATCACCVCLATTVEIATPVSLGATGGVAEATMCSMP